MTAGAGASAATGAIRSYLSDAETGVSSALACALQKLLEQEALPDNPAFFIASVLMAYQDRAPAWSESREDLLGELDINSPTVHDASRLVCKLASSEHAWGLPHVVRCLSTQGIEALHHVLVHNLHNSFFNSAAPYQAGTHGAVARVMCSLQGSTVSYNPARQLFPRVNVRGDVLISGMSIEAAVDTLATLIMRDARELQQLPLNSLTAVRARLPSSLDEDAVADSADVKIPAMTRQQIDSDSVAFLQMVKKAILSSMVRHSVTSACSSTSYATVRMFDTMKLVTAHTLLWNKFDVQYLEAEFVLIGEVASSLDAAAKAQELQPTIFLAVKAYHLHLQSVNAPSENAFINAASITHYGDSPYEALLSGIFMEEAAMRMYLSMYSSECGSPYAEELCAQHEKLLNIKVLDCFQSGALQLAKSCL